MRSSHGIEGGLAPYAPLTPAASRLARSATHACMIGMLMMLSACDLAPDYTLPDILKPAAFKEDTATAAATVEPASDGKWKRVDEHAQITEFAWWRMFNDATLDGLMEKAMKENPSLDVAINRVRAARSVVDTRAAELYPAIGIGAGPERTRQSPAAQQVNLPPGQIASVKPYTLYTARGTITYDLDLFGQNRARTRAAEADADAEQDNYRAARLSLQAEIAQTYYRVAALRAEKTILEETRTTRERFVALTRERTDVGEGDPLVLASAETDLASVAADAAGVAQSLAVNEHALATLVGIPPSELKTETTDLASPPPSIPAGLPSSLLERRPDIKRAVSLIAAANERIGVARGGYFPDISLSAAGGFVAGDLSDLFEWSNRTWTIGPLAGTILTQPIFEGGKLAAARAQTQADYEAATATYREAVLTAFREVEDQLSGVTNVNTQATATESGVTAATRAYDVASQRYEVGYSSYIEYLDTERSFLAAKRSNVQVRGNQYITTIQLVKALGGSWESPAAPVATGSTAAAPAPATN